MCPDMGLHNALAEEKLNPKLVAQEINRIKESKLPNLEGKIIINVEYKHYPIEFIFWS